jgi:hypothetical protein
MVFLGRLASPPPRDYKIFILAVPRDSKSNFLQNTLTKNRLFVLLTFIFIGSETSFHPQLITKNKILKSVSRRASAKTEAF